MKQFNIVVLLLFMNIQHSFAQFNQFKFAPEVSFDYARSTHVICTANLFKIKGGAGSPYVGMDNFGVGLGVSIKNQTAIPELAVNYTKTIYLFDFGIRSKISLNSNEKFFVVSPTVGLSLFGFLGVFYSYNLGDFSSSYLSDHAVGIRMLISDELFKKDSR